MSLLTLLLPETTDNLYIAGDPTLLQKFPTKVWKNVIVLPSDSTAPSRTSVSPTTDNTLLVTDWKIYRKHRHLIPSAKLVYFGKYRKPLSQLGADYFVLIAYPFWGRPLVWCRDSTCRLFDVYPRGRFDIFVLKIHQIIQWPILQLLAPMIVVHRQQSQIAQLMRLADVDSNAWYQTKTGQIIMMDTKSVLKISTKTGENVRVQSQRLTQAREDFIGYSILRYMPIPGRHIQIAASQAYVEQKLAGQSALSIIGNQGKLERVFSRAAVFLQNWYVDHSQQTIITDIFFKRHWVDALFDIDTRLTACGQQDLWQGFLKQLKQRLIGKSILIVPEHGDFWLNNLLIDTDLAISGVIDWDAYQREGLPLLDLLHLMSWRSSRFVSDLSHRKFKYFMQENSSFRWRIIKRHCDAIQLAPFLIKDLFIRYWLEHIARRINEFKSDRFVVNQVRRLSRQLD